MPNAWDGLSALLLKQAGFEALGTASVALASASRVDLKRFRSSSHKEGSATMKGSQGLPR